MAKKKFADLANACWKTHKAIGMKPKGDRMVPNCVPKNPKEEYQLESKKDEEEIVDRVERSDYKVSPSGRKTHKQIVFKMGDEEMKEEVELEEATVKTQKYSWGTMKTVHHGSDISYPLHPEHQKIVKDLRPSGEHSKAMYKDETGNQVHVTREGDKVHFVSHRTSGSKKTTVDYKHFDESVSVPAKNTDVSDKSWLKDAGKKPSIKSDLKNFKNFLTGKKETNEEVEQISELDKSTVKSYLKKKIQKPGVPTQKDVDGMARATVRLMNKEQAPVAPVPDKKYIKGTPEYKAYKATKKPINGMPTNVKEESELDESSYNNPHKFAAQEIKAGTFKSYSNNGYVVRYNNPKSEKHGSEKHFDNQAAAQKHADRGNSVDKIGGKYTVHKTNEKGHDMNEELKGNQHKLDKNKNGKLDKQDFKLLRKETFEDGELETNVKSYKEFLQSLDEIKMADLPSRKVSGGKYGTEYYKGEAEKDVKGYDDEDKPAKPAGEKRGRGRPAGSTSGARQKGTIAKRKGSGVEMTGYPVHLPNFK